MHQTTEGLLFSFIAVSFLIVFLVLLLVNLLLTGRNRQLKHRTALLEIQARTQREITEAKMEVAEQTMTDVARDLHDDVGQLLMFSLIHINLLQEENDPPAEHLAEVHDALQRAVDSLRAISKNLSRDYILNAGLTIALSRLFEQLYKQPGLVAEGHWPPDLQLSSPEKELFVFRIIQECITNTIKHAGATKIALSLTLLNDSVQVNYSDNGKGISEFNKGIPVSMSVGLSTMMKRAELINGELKIENNPSGGIIISLLFPK